MRIKSVVLIVVALACGLVASIGISQVLDQSSDTASAVETIPIYVALADIDINEKLDATHVKVEQWPADKVPKGAISKLEDAKGKFACVRLYEGEPLTSRKITDSVTNKSIDIPVDFRVSSVKVQMDTSVSFLIQPGDRVDVIATFHRSQEIPQTMSIPVLRDVRVFAVNSETDRETNDGNPIVAKTVSLLLKKNQDEVLSLASELGSVRLSLRNPKEPTETDSDSIAADQSVTLEQLLAGPTDDEHNSEFAEYVRTNQSPADYIGESPKSAVTSETIESWRLVILNGDGASTYVWRNENGPPMLQASEPTSPFPTALASQYLDSESTQTDSETDEGIDSPRPLDD